MSDEKIVLVTGAGGFIGGWVTEALFLRRYARPRAGLRQWSNAARIARFPLEMVQCDIMDREQVASAMAGVSGVVHCAYSDSPEVIVEGTRNMLAAATEAGVESFVYLSTAEIYGNVSGDVCETVTPVSTDSVYATAKREAEMLCRDFCERDLSTIILRPSVVYGPFSKSWTVRLAKRLQSGNWGEFEKHGEGICNLVYVDDLVSAVLAGLRSPNAAGEAFNVNGPDRVTWNEYFRRFNDQMGLPKLDKMTAGKTMASSAIKGVVGKAARSVMNRFRGTIMPFYERDGLPQRIMRRVKSSLETTPSTKELGSLFSRDAYFVTSKARDLLGYAPRFDLDRGLRMCVLWLEHHGYVDRRSVRLDSSE